MRPRDSEIYGYPSEEGSPSSPSHQRSGIAATTQFPPGTSGWTHIGFAFQATIAGHQKQAATPTAHVRVGVIYRRTLLVGDQVHKVPPADGAQQKGPGTKA